MSKSPVQIARLALRSAEEALGNYSCPKAKHDFTQPQLFAILALKAFFRTDYRGIVDLLEDLVDLRRELGLKKVPHYSTLCYAEQRLLKKGLLPWSNALSFLRHGEQESFDPLAGLTGLRGSWTPRAMTR